MNEIALKKLAQKIALETFTIWEELEAKGTAAAGPHLAAALHTLARCGISPGRQSFTDWVVRRTVGVLPARRRAALRALGFVALAPVSPRIIDLMLRRLRSPQWQNKLVVLEALRAMQISCKQKELFLLVVRELENRRMSVRVAAAQLLMFWERSESADMKRAQMAWKPKGTAQSRYLLDLVHDIARSQEAKEREDVPLLALDGSLKPEAFTERRRAEIERLLTLLTSPNLARRQQAARALGERMQAGVRIAHRGTQRTVLLPFERR